MSGCSSGNTGVELAVYLHPQPVTIIRDFKHPFGCRRKMALSLKMPKKSVTRRCRWTWIAVSIAGTCLEGATKYTGLKFNKHKQRLPHIGGWGDVVSSVSCQCLPKFSQHLPLWPVSHYPPSISTILWNPNHFPTLARNNTMKRPTYRLYSTWFTYADRFLDRRFVSQFCGNDSWFPWWACPYAPAVSMHVSAS